MGSGRGGREFTSHYGDGLSREEVKSRERKDKKTTNGTSRRGQGGKKA